MRLATTTTAVAIQGPQVESIPARVVSRPGRTRSAPPGRGGRSWPEPGRAGVRISRAAARSSVSVASLSNEPASAALSGVGRRPKPNLRWRLALGCSSGGLSMSAAGAFRARSRRPRPDGPPTSSASSSRKRATAIPRSAGSPEPNPGCMSAHLASKSTPPAGPATSTSCFTAVSRSMSILASTKPESSMALRCESNESRPQRRACWRLRRRREHRGIGDSVGGKSGDQIVDDATRISRESRSI